jgi:hypothetical protein
VPGRRRRWTSLNCSISLVALVLMARMPSWADATPPWPGAWCRACRGTRWWTERRDSKGWRCLRCCPPSHLPPEEIRREGEADDAPAPAARAPAHDADPLFRQAGIGALDHAGALRIESG